MSRYSKKTEEKTLIYGWDHALGYFYEVWENSREEDAPPLKDRCSMFGMRRDEMAEVLTEFKANRNHLQKLALDLPF